MYWRDAAQRFQGSGDLADGLLRLVEAYDKEPLLDSNELDMATKELYEIRFGAVLAQHPRLLKHCYHPDMQAMALSDDCRFVLTGGRGEEKDSYELRIWDATNGRPLHRLVVNYQVNAVAFSAGNQYLLAATGKKGEARGELAVWSWPDTKQQPEPIAGQRTETAPVLVAAFIPSPNCVLPRIVSISQDANSVPSVKRWQSLNEPPQELKGAEPESRQMAAAGIDLQGDSVPSALTVSPDGRFAATWGDRDRGSIWNVEEQASGGGGLRNRSIPLGTDQIATVILAVFSANGEWLAAIDRQGSARLWETASGKLLCEWTAHMNGATYVAFSPDDQQLLTSGDDSAAKIWEIIVERRHPAKAAMAEAKTQASQRVLDESVSASISVMLKSTLAHESWVNCAKFSPDGSRVATASRDRTVRLWDVESERSIGSPLHHAFGVSDLNFSPDGLHLVTRIRDTLQFWELSGRNPPPRPLRVGEWGMHTVYSENGRHLAIFAKTDRGAEAWVWDVSAGTCSDVHLLEQGDDLFVSYACLSDNGRRVLAVTQEGFGDSPSATVHVWDTAQEERVQLTMRTLGVVRLACFSSDGGQVLTVSEPFRGAASDTGDRFAQNLKQSGKSPPWQLQVWNVATGEPLLSRMQDQIGPVNHIVWHKQSPSIVISAGDTKDSVNKTGSAHLWYWNAAQSQLVSRWEWRHTDRGSTSDAILFAAFSPDGSLVATGGADDATHLWNVADGQRLSARLEHASDIAHITFSADGSQLATCSIGDKKVCVWDVKKIRDAPIAQPKCSFEHKSSISRAVFNSNGRLLATLTDDGFLRVWSVAERTRVGRLRGGDLAVILRHDSSVASAFFDDDGGRLITVDGTFRDRWPQRREWRLKLEPDAGLPLNDPDKLRDLARLLAGGELDSESDIMRQLSPTESPQAGAVPTSHTVRVADDPARTESARACKLNSLWQEFREVLCHGDSASVSHLLMADASEAAGQWFAAAWHLEQMQKNDGKTMNAAEQEEITARRNIAYVQYVLTRASYRESINRPASALEEYDAGIRRADPPHWSLFNSRAQLNSRLNQLRPAIDDRTQAIRWAPSAKHIELFAQRADDFARMNNWADAVADCAAVYKALPNRYSGYRLALAQLRLTDPDAYRRTCDDLFARYANSSDLRDANSTLWACVLAPYGHADYAPIVDAARRVTRQAEVAGSPVRNLYLNTLGAAYFRAGNWDAAQDSINEGRRAYAQLRQQNELTRRDIRFDVHPMTTKIVPAVPDDSLSDEDGTTLDWLLLAMICQRRSEIAKTPTTDAAQALKWLQVARAGRERDARNSWVIRAELDVLFAEAETLINGPAATPAENDSAPRKRDR